LYIEDLAKGGACLKRMMSKAHTHTPELEELLVFTIGVRLRNVKLQVSIFLDPEIDTDISIT